MKKGNTRLWIELMKTDLRKLRHFVNELSRVKDISLENLNVTTVLDGELVMIDSIRFYYDEDMFFCSESKGGDVLASYDIYDIPRGGLTDIILELESRLK
jgi:hypothetical protein